MPAAAGSTVHFPLLALILAQFMVGYVMWTADRLPALARVRAWRPSPAALAAATPGPVPAPAGAASSGPSAAPSPPLSPRLASCCNIVMGLVMGYMLIISL
jgi:hypothetical protein